MSNVFTATTLQELEGIFARFVADKLLPGDASNATWAAVQALPTLATLLRDNAKFKMNYDAAVRIRSSGSRDLAQGDGAR